MMNQDPFHEEDLILDQGKRQSVCIYSMHREKKIINKIEISTHLDIYTKWWMKVPYSPS